MKSTIRVRHKRSDGLETRLRRLSAFNLLEVSQHVLCRSVTLPQIAGGSLSDDLVYLE